MFNRKNVLLNCMSAAIGVAVIGGFFGVVGSMIGAVIGAIVGLFISPSKKIDYSSLIKREESKEKAKNQELQQIA